MMGEHKRKKSISTGTDQWKSEGDCKQCRRKNYCKTTCQAHAANIQRHIMQRTMSIFTKMLEKT